MQPIPPKKATRRRLIEAAFHEIYRKGFQAASISDILVSTGVTRGALYHYFRSKRELGLAVIDEYVSEIVRSQWIEPLEGCEDPIQRFNEVLEMRVAGMRPEDVELGCPLANIAQEMSPIDDAFRCRVESIYDCWRQAVADALGRGQSVGRVKSDVDTKSVAGFIVGAMAGCLGMAKNARSLKMLRDDARCLQRYMESLRA